MAALPDPDPDLAGEAALEHELQRHDVHGPLELEEDPLRGAL